ncbi:MAG: hypothetical protein B6D39_05515 [Anaerolineae bacterium UTCFX2]|jgi:hypothetical protein|nr:hypothetical protein [Anaerolineales bacterium]OQY91825.1 MAG: hypothetical protein B6D39_05515 [Anaerolineae bacterium UTCFX2]
MKKQNPSNANVFRILISLGLLAVWVFLSLDIYQSLLGNGLKAGFGITLLRLTAAVGSLIFLLAALGLLAQIWAPERVRIAGGWLIRLRERLGAFRWLLAFLLALLPGLILLFTPLGQLLPAGYIRLGALLLAGFLAGLFAGRSPTQPLTGADFAFGVLLTATGYVFGSFLTLVTAYPFSLSWSEGNRLYDYSIPFGSGRYQFVGQPDGTYDSVGRSLLWGLAFLVRDLPIWAHRLWNAFLSTAPHLLLGYLLARWSRIGGRERWLFGMWFFLFLAQGPIYTPLILSAILLIMTVSLSRWLLSAFGAALAGYYASLSRWTWLPASATWAGFLMLADFRLKKGEGWLAAAKRLIPVAVAALAGLAGGALANPKLFRPAKIAQGTSLSQPLLWYRLFPNSTSSLGLLLSLAIAVLPLVVLLIWAQASGRWKLNWVQILAFSLPSLALLGAGLVMSVKIGGGNNLHNLDMFLISLAFLAAILLRDLGGLKTEGLGWLPRSALALALLIPAWNALWVGVGLDLPPRAETAETLKVIRKQVERAAQAGEVLFMDQRQLLTFGYIQDMPLVAEYEKKYVMDQAMADNARYFADFYEDLRNKRFALIVAPPLFLIEKGSEFRWGEENDAWQKWVVAPLLCYYKPIRTFTNDSVQLLTPRDTPKNCPAGLETP